MQSSANPSTFGQIEGKPLTDFCLVPVDRAAEALGIKPKALIGLMARNVVGDPIGDGKEVYGWSCKETAERLSAVKSVATDTSAVVPCPHCDAPPRFCKNRGDDQKCTCPCHDREVE